MPGGRPRKPTSLKKAQGNPGRRKLNTAEPSVGGVPVKPKTLPDRGSKLWDEMVLWLEKMGCLDTADALALEMIAEVYAEWRACLDVVEKEGRVYYTTTMQGDRMVRTNPHVVMAGESWRRLKSLISEFGFTPASRTKLGTTSEEFDELGNILNGYTDN